MKAQLQTQKQEGLAGLCAQSRGKEPNVRDCYVVSCQRSFLYLYPPHPHVQGQAVNLSPPLDGEQLEGLWLSHLCIPSAGFPANI